MPAARLLGWWLAAAVCAAGQVSVRDVGAFEFELSQPAAHGLSGIAYAGDDLYWVASDAGAYLHRIEIRLDRSSGAVVGVEPRGGVELRDAEGESLPAPEWKDREDLALIADDVFLVNELCGLGDRPCIDRHRLDDGRLLSRTGPASGGQLAVFAHAEANRGFEAIVARPGDRGFWVAAERALPVDGKPATPDAGSPVRLQSLDSELRGAAQYVYVTDPIERRILWPPYLTPHSGSRVVGLLVLPDDSLIVMENVFQGNSLGVPQSRVRLYEVDLSGATDVSRGELAEGLAGHDFEPVGKRRLIELRFNGVSSNFEGITPGPRLDDGDYAVLLVRDNGTGADQTVYALRLRAPAEASR